MIKTRTMAAQSVRLVCAAILSVGALTASAKPGGQEANASLIQFSAAEGLKASNAASILSSRLDLRNGVDELRSAYVENPGDGLEVQRFHQYFKGVKVAHGSYTLTSKDGLASFAFGKFYRLDAGTSIAPSLAEADALNLALAATGASKYMWQVDKSQTVPKADLEFVEDYTTVQLNDKPVLAYVFDIYAVEPLSREKVYVDAASGKILLRDAILKHVNASGKSLYSDTVSYETRIVNAKYHLNDASRGSGIVTFDLKTGTNAGAGTTDTVESSTSFFIQDPAVDAHWGATQVYDYWKNIRNRNSWNGTNGILKSYVHYSTNYNNAFWDGSAMFYGDGSGVSTGGLSPLTSLDVCAHEIGHGICQSTAALVYSRESGAMNEGFSDIWGAVVEAFADPKEKDKIAKDRWLIGEELTNTFRSMRDPKAYQQPSTYQGAYWIYTGSGCDNSNDRCGVHTNSGVLNHWFYLLTEGGKGTNDIGDQYQVLGVGMSKSAAIAYATELALTSSSNFAAARTASIAAATTLYGACSPEVEAVTRAWYAVGVGTNYNACAPQISFGASTVTELESVPGNTCSPSRIVNLPVVLNGPAPTGGNATVTINVAGGTAVAGVDFDIPSNTVTFAAGSSASQNVGITIYDNGSLGANKYIDLAFSLTANGSNIVLPGIMDTVRVTISNDDKAPAPGNIEFHNAGVSQVAANSSSPFLSGYANGRGQYIYSATELSNGGLKAGVPITEASFNVSLKNSSQAFNGYTIKMGHTNQINFTSASFLNNSGFTTVYSGNLTTKSGWNAIPLSTTFVWDGVSNIVVEVCFSNTSAGASNDRVSASSSGSAAATAWSNTNNGCSLTLTGANISPVKPVIRFTQNVAPAGIATNVNDTRSWTVRKNHTVYFATDPGKKYISGLLNMNKDFGCVSSTVTVAGTGFTPASGGKVRSVKEFEMTRTQASGTDTFDVILYFTNEELNGMNPEELYMVQSTSVNDQNLLPSNTQIVIPNEIIYGENWVGFRGTFNEMKRFYLTNGMLALSTETVKRNSDDMWTGANPFVNSPILHWNTSKTAPATIRLTDITGKVVYSIERQLEAGAHSLELNSSNSYAPGTYILQVIRPSGVFTRQLVKQ